MSNSFEITEIDTFFSSKSTSSNFTCSLSSLSREKSKENKLIFTPNYATRAQINEDIDIISFEEIVNQNTLPESPKSLSKPIRLSGSKTVSNINIRRKEEQGNGRLLNKPKLLHKSFQKIIQSTEEEIKSFTNTENISNFYEYTESCAKLILKLKAQKDNMNRKLPSVVFPLDPMKKIAIFDLDETLVHCKGETKTYFESTEKQILVTVTIPSKKKINIAVNIRPFWKEALDIIKENYNIIIYTASHKSYADAVLNALDERNEYFQNRLYRNNCVQVKVEEQTFYIKDWNIFEEHYNWKDIVIIDNSVLSFANHLDNGIPIVPYYEHNEDKELMLLAGYLWKIFEYDDWREINKKAVNMDAFLFEASKELEKEMDEKDEDSEDLSTEEQETEVATPLKTPENETKTKNAHPLNNINNQISLHFINQSHFNIDTKSTLKSLKINQKLTHLKVFELLNDKNKY